MSTDYSVMQLRLRSFYRAHDMGNSEPLRQWAESELVDILPHGSGINSSWTIDVLKNGNIVAHNSFHGMNDGGMYDGWQDFTIKLFRHTRDVFNPLRGPCAGQTQVVHRAGDIDFKLSLSGQRVRRSWAYGLTDYLAETIHYCLSEAHILTKRNEVINAPTASA